MKMQRGQQRVSVLMNTGYIRMQWRSRWHSNLKSVSQEVEAVSRQNLRSELVYLL